MIALLASLYTIFVGNAVSVGGCRYFMENREHQTSASKVFYGFQNGRYGNVVKTMFFRDLFILLWTLLLIVPGIIKATVTDLFHIFCQRIHIWTENVRWS